MEKKITPDTPIYSYNRVKELLESLKLYDGGEMQSIAEASHNSRFNDEINKRLIELERIFNIVSNA